MRKARYIEAVLRVLETGEEHTVREIATLADLSLSATYSALRTLKIQGKVRKMGLWRAKYKIRCHT